MGIFSRRLVLYSVDFCAWGSGVVVLEAIDGGALPVDFCAWGLGAVFVEAIAGVAGIASIKRFQAICMTIGGG